MGRHRGNPSRGSSHARLPGQLLAVSLARRDACTPTTLLGTGLTRPGPGCPEDCSGQDALPDHVGAHAVLPGARALPARQRRARKQTEAASESRDPGLGRG